MTSFTNSPYDFIMNCFMSLLLWFLDLCRLQSLLVFAYHLFVSFIQIALLWHHFLLFFSFVDQQSRRRCTRLCWVVGRILILNRIIACQWAHKLLFLGANRQAQRRLQEASQVYFLQHTTLVIVSHTRRRMMKVIRQQHHGDRRSTFLSLSFLSARQSNLTNVRWIIHVWFNDRRTATGEWS